jgi:putative transcriptional regulator
MTIKHHPPQEFIARFAAGRLDRAEHIVIATHVSMCARCRRFVAAFERLGGTALEAAEPVALAAGAFDAVMARIGAAEAVPPPPAVPRPRQAQDAGLPKVLDRYDIGRVRRIAPGLSMRPIMIPGAGRSRAFLLRSEPGTHMLEHTHTETELTCVLEGSFSHEGGHFGPGDFDLGDDTVDHRPIVGADLPCVCLVAMSGKLRINGFLGRLIEPFIRL